MNISIFGLGYVGAVTAGCLARQGHSIVGVDIHAQKVASFNEGISPIIEPGVSELLAAAKAARLLRATQDAAEAVRNTELSIICVGTPSTAGGALNISFVRGVVEQIAATLRASAKKHVLVFRSTMLPGSTQKLVSDLLSDLTASEALQVFYYPEFLRESTAVADFENPSLAVIGTADGTPPPTTWLASLFGVQAAVVDWQTAEMVKYACNAFHAAKIAFANEIGRVSKQSGIDGQQVMSLLCRDTRLNLSASYLRPGTPFGGSCLSKDVRALTHQGRQLGLQLPVLENLLASNESHLQSLLQLIAETGQREVVILGLSFKANTDDLRESAMVALAQELLTRGYPLRIFDSALNLAGLVGANKRFVDAQMPHLATMLKRSLREALGDEGVVVVSQPCTPIEELKKVLTTKHHVIDVNGWNELRGLPVRYEGLCW